MDPLIRPVTDAARIVRAGLPAHHGLEVSDLVSIGYEAALCRGLRHSMQPVLVFVCAKQAMVAATRLWSGKSENGYVRRTFSDPAFCEYDDRVAVWDQWRRHMLPLESMIDLKRALLSMRLREAVAWYSHCWLEEPVAHLRGELGVGDERLKQYCATARSQLVAVWGDAGATRKKSATGENAERRARYSELRRLGATAKQAARNLTVVKYSAMVRQLTMEAAE